MIIEIFGMGCAKCEQLTKNVQRAVEELGIEAQVNKIEDFEMFIRRGITMTPGLVIDGEIRSMGRVPSVNEIKEMIETGCKEMTVQPTSRPQRALLPVDALGWGWHSIPVPEVRTSARFPTTRPNPCPSRDWANSHAWPALAPMEKAS